MDDQERSYHRILIIFGVCFFISIILLIRLIQIQILNYPKYSHLSAIQRQIPLLNSSLRGNFLDRNQRMLRGSMEAWYLLFEKVNYDRFKRISAKLEPILNGDLFYEYQKNKNKPVWIYPKPLNKLQIQKIYSLNYKDLKIISNSTRKDYRSGIAGHLLGFVGKDYGFSGLEYLYQPLFKNTGSTSTVFTLADGMLRNFAGLGIRTKKTLNSIGVILTIDSDIQMFVDQEMDQNHLTSAIVILDVKTGEILAMSSRPLVDFNKLADSKEEQPFLNRAVSAYQPGSIFKLVLLSAGLDSGFLHEDDSFFDRGNYQRGARKWLCTTSNGVGHGHLNLTEALAYSCNPTFIEIALGLEPKLILEYADKFGLGQPCNIGLLDEAWGKLPSGIGLSIGEQANMALGQENIYTTPLQIASLIQAIANDGERCNPRLVLGTIHSSGGLVELLDKDPPLRIIKAETARAIQKMMAAVINYGTGTAARIECGAAGKTGTAQLGAENNLPQHAWFAGFAPLEDPRYVGVVFCEKGSSGGETAAPVFKTLMEKVTKLRD